MAKRTSNRCRCVTRKGRRYCFKHTSKGIRSCKPRRKGRRPR